MKKAWTLLLVILLLFGVSACNSTKNMIAGKWELLGVCDDGTIIPGNFADFEYFNVNLSEDGIVNLFSEPQNYGMLGMYHKIGEKSKGVYEYSALLYKNSTVGSQQEEHIVQMLYYPDKDELLMLFSENDGFYFTRVPDECEEYTPHCADGIHRNKDTYTENNEAIVAKYGYGWDQVYNDKWGECEWVLMALTTQEELDAYKARAAEFEKENKIGWYIIPELVDGYRVVSSPRVEMQPYIYYTGIVEHSTNSLSGWKLSLTENITVWDANGAHTCNALYFYNEAKLGDQPISVYEEKTITLYGTPENYRDGGDFYIFDPVLVSVDTDSNTENISNQNFENKVSLIKKDSWYDNGIFSAYFNSCNYGNDTTWNYIGSSHDVFNLGYLDYATVDVYKVTYSNGKSNYYFVPYHDVVGNAPVVFVFLEDGQKPTEVWSGIS